MAIRYFTTVMLILHVTCLTIAWPTINTVREAGTTEREEQSTGRELTDDTSDAKSGDDLKSQTLRQQTEKIIRSAAVLQADVLQLLNMAPVPILDTTKEIPATLLKGAANLASSEDFHRFESFGEQAKSAVQEQVLVPVESFVAKGIDEIRNLIPSALDGHQLGPLLKKVGNYVMTNQEGAQQGTVTIAQRGAIQESSTQ